MKAKDTKFAKQYSAYYSNGIFINWQDGWETLTNESALELNTILAEFLDKKAKWKDK